jgi:predicted RNA-binding Zn-ribbon protein involved in translation (DUF1610 family)
MLLKFACPSCGRHISATRAQIGITVRCPNCNAAVAVPKTSTLPPPPPAPLVRFACPSCGQHISATCAQIGITAPCPICNTAVTVPKISTLPPPPPAPLKTKFRKKDRYETTVILIDDSAVPTTTRKLKKWTDDFTDARNWVIRQLHAFRGDRYFAGIFDHKERKSVFKEKGR